MTWFRRLGVEALKARGFIASLIALLLVWRGQVAYDAHDLGGWRLDLLGCVVLIVGYLFTYKNHRFFREGDYLSSTRKPAPSTTLPTRRVATPIADTTPTTTLPLRHITAPAADTAATPPPASQRKWWISWQEQPLTIRLALGAIAIALNVLAVIIYEGDPLSGFAILLWAIGLGLLALACARQRHEVWPVNVANPDEAAPGEDDGVIARRSVTPNRRLEYLLLGLILLFALGARLYGLTYPHIGIHSDEAEIGLVARDILHGNFAAAPPLITSRWYYYPSAAMWTLLPGMIMFGDDTPAGIHFSGGLFSVLDIFAVFLLVRLLWGSRPALIAAALMAGSTPLLHLSLYPAATEQMGLCWALAFYFFFKGLRSRRYLDFVWAGYAAAGSLYFYPSSRAIVALFAALIGYLFITRLRFLPNYWRQIGIFALSFWLLAAPMLVYTFYHQEVLFKRLSEVSIFTDYGSSIAFSDWGIPYTIGSQPITPETVLANWQPWLTLLTEQAKHTYLALTYYDDGTYFYQTGKPVLPTLPAMLAVLGIAYCLWRWRDPRYFLLTVWFWLGLFLSTVLTTNPPELLRMAGIVQTFYIFIAIALNKILYEVERNGWFSPGEVRHWSGQQLTTLRGAVAGRLQVRPLRSPTLHLVAPTTWWRRPSDTNIVAGLLVALLAVQGVQQYYDVFRDTKQQWADLSIDGYYLSGVQQNYYVYYMVGQGETINFVNIRFLAKNLQGEDIQHPLDVLPFSAPLQKDALFMLPPRLSGDGDTISAIYPETIKQTIPFIDGQAFRRVYIVRASEANAEHGVRAGYFAGGNVYQLGRPLLVRQERSVGLDANNPPPANLSYPAVGVWEGSIYAPQSGDYTLKIEGGAGLLAIDQTTVLRVKAGQEGGAAQVQLTRGWHPFSMRVALLSANQPVHLGMVAAGEGEQPIPFAHLYPRSLRGIISGSGQASAIGGSSTPPIASLGHVSPLQIINEEPNSTFVNAVAVDDSGNIFVGGDGPPHIYKYDPSGKLVTDWAVLPDQPGQSKATLTDIAVDHQGQVYVLDPTSKNLEVYDNNGKLLGHRNSDNKFAAYGPQGLAVDQAGNLYIADTGGSRILEIDSHDNLVREIGGGLSYPDIGTPPQADPRRTYQPIDLTITADGSIYVVDLHHRIIKYGADGKYAAEWQLPNIGGGIASLHMASYKGFVYLSDTSSQSIYRLDSGGNIALFGDKGDDAGLFNNPAGLATDAAGRLYVADRNNRRVQVFDLSGK